MIVRAAVAACALSLSFGCTERAQQACRMAAEEVIGVTRRPPSAVALARTGPDRFLASWSADGETWAAWLDGGGAAAAGPLRVERAPAGVAPAAPDGEPKTFWPSQGRFELDAEDIDAAAVGGGAALLAILETAAGARRGGLFAVLLAPGGAPSGRALRVGPAGAFATRTAAAAMGERAIVAWHEGAADASRVRIAAIGIDPLRVLESGTVPGSGSVSGPAVAASGERVLLAWVETASGEGTPRSAVRVASVGPDLRIGRPVEVATCSYVDTAPSLVAVGEGFGLVYRDDADSDDLPEFYFTLLDREGNVARRPSRISRADGFQGVRISYGGGWVHSAAIRSFQRNLLVGMNRFDLRGEKAGGEFQVYADDSDFVRVDVWADGEEALLVYGEDRRGAGRVLAARVECREGGR